MTDRDKVLDWLRSIGETDPACITEVLADCAANKEARAFYVSKYDFEVVPMKRVAA